MDVSMPVLDGLEATRQIREGACGESARHVPIVAMTANAMEGDRNRCLEAGMDDYISKPIDQTKLVDLLERVRLGKTCSSPQPWPGRSQAGDENLLSKSF
jgi:CheY-like chemotaxis protein